MDFALRYLNIRRIIYVHVYRYKYIISYKIWGNFIQYSIQSKSHQFRSSNRGNGYPSLSKF